MLLEQFDYCLPQELIATEPVKPRDQAKLLVLKNNIPQPFIIKDFVNFVSPEEVVVFNDTKVLPAKLEAVGKKGKISFNLHKMISSNVWLAFAKPASKVYRGEKLAFGEEFEAEVLDKNYGEVTLKLFDSSSNFMEKLNKYGTMPLPPYIEKKVGIRQSDKEDYQTIFATHEGSVAAPTAGLHFTEDLLKALKDKGVKTAYITLHVGAGTFLPVKTSNIESHKMHSEIGIITKEKAESIMDTKANGGKVIAIGTTSARLLESASTSEGKLKEFHGETDIFIKPGYSFRIVDMLMTNFHLPKSTLLMLVSAFAGRKEIMTAYDYAIQNRFRFYSYGDASLLYKKVEYV